MNSLTPRALNQSRQKFMFPAETADNVVVTFLVEHCTPRDPATHQTLDSALMRHDAKLGLALGMLVIGFAVAFCFPRQPMGIATNSPEAPVPVAHSNLDFLPIRAYQPPADKSNSQNPQESNSVTIAQQEQTKSVSAAPAPIAPLVTAQLPESNAEIPEQQSPKTPVNALEESPAVVELYRVKPGDTLSGIAGRCLGSTARYQELYEANRDVLTSPNDLKIGMELRLRPARMNDPASSSLAQDDSPQKLQNESSQQNLKKAGTSGKTGIHEPPQVPWLADRPQERR